MLFFGVTGALMLGVLGSASVGVNTQRYSDAVNTFTAIIQQEFTNATNVVNTKSVQNMCGAGDDSELPRGISNCAIIGRLMTVDEEGNIARSNLVGEDPGTTQEDDTELGNRKVSKAPKWTICRPGVSGRISTQFAAPGASSGARMRRKSGAFRLVRM